MASTSQICQALRTQIQELNRHAEHLDQLSGTDFEGARLKALHVAEKLVDLLTTSKEKLSRRIFTATKLSKFGHEYTLTRYNLAEFEHGHQSLQIVQRMIVTKQDSRSSKPLTESQQEVQDASRNDLVVRILRALAAGGFVEEIGDDVYAPNSVTQALTEPANIAMFIHNFDVVLSATIQTPTYLLQNSHALSPSQTPFQFSYQTSLSYFDWLLAHPSSHDRFNTSMQANRLDKPFWASWFPVREQLLTDFDPALSGGGEPVFLVDIGGNTGYDLLRLRKSLSEKDGDTVGVVGREGCLVLQDLPEVIESISEEEVLRLDEAGVRRQRHDFLMPQPIQGAHIYFMHFILHDFPNSAARLIIHNIAMSMTPNYSRLLLNEIILPARGVPLQMALWDIEMMTLLGGRERTESEWVELVEDICSVGENLRLEVVRFWSPPSGAGEGIIEIIRRA